MKTTQLSHNIPRPGRHTVLSNIVFLLTTLCSILLLFPSLSFSSVTTTYEYNALDRVSVVGSETSFTEVYPR